MDKPGVKDMTGPVIWGPKHTALVLMETTKMQYQGKGFAAEFWILISA